MLVLIITGWVGLATILAAVSLVPAFWFLDASTAGMLFALVTAAFITFTHRSNIRNMRPGDEHRFDRIRAVNWFGSR